MADLNVLFHDYAPAVLAARMAAIEKDLKVASDVPNDGGTASNVNSARQKLLGFLKGAHDGVANSANPVEQLSTHAKYAHHLRAAYVAVSGRRPGDVDDAVVALNGLKKLASADVATALHREDTTYEVEEEILNPKEIDIGTKIVEKTLPGFKGTPPTPDELQRLLALLSLCSRGAEFNFRLGLLTTE